MGLSGLDVTHIRGRIGRVAKEDGRMRKEHSPQTPQTSSHDTHDTSDSGSGEWLAVKIGKHKSKISLVAVLFSALGIGVGFPTTWVRLQGEMDHLRAQNVIQTQALAIQTQALDRLGRKLDGVCTEVDHTTRDQAIMKVEQGAAKERYAGLLRDLKTAQTEHERRIRALELQRLR